MTRPDIPAHVRAMIKAKRVAARQRRRREREKAKAKAAPAREAIAVALVGRALVEACLRSRLTVAQVQQVRARFGLLDAEARDRVAAQLVSTRRLPKCLEPGVLEVPAAASGERRSAGGIVLP